MTKSDDNNAMECRVGLAVAASVEPMPVGLAGGSRDGIDTGQGGKGSSNAHDGLHEGIYTKQGVPTCLWQIPMEYVRSDPDMGHLYRCRGCNLDGTMRGGIRHCDSQIWEDPARNIRLFGVVRRGSQEWKDLYTKRQAIERVFKSMKESRRLERHCVRGLRQITLQAAMSALAFQATVLVRLWAGETEWMRWMVRRVD